MSIHDEVPVELHKGSSAGGSHGRLRSLAMIALLVGATASVGMLLRAGRNSPRFLMALFVIWVLSPFIALLLADVISKRWSVITRAMLHGLMLVITLGSLTAYVIDTLGPRRTQAAFVYVAVPLGSWLLIVIAVSIAALMNTKKRNTAYTLSKVYSVPPVRLFNSFLDEATLKKIWGVSSITIDAKPEGKACAKMQIGDENWDFTITYKEVAPDKKLRWVVNFDRFPAKDIWVTLRFKALPEGTELTVSQENFESSQERDGNRQAWESALLTLEGLVSQ